MADRILTSINIKRVSADDGIAWEVIFIYDGGSEESFQPTRDKVEILAKELFELGMWPEGLPWP